MSIGSDTPLSDYFANIVVINRTQHTQQIRYVRDNVLDFLEVEAGKQVRVTTTGLIEKPSPQLFTYVEPSIDNPLLRQLLGFPSDNAAENPNAANVTAVLLPDSTAGTEVVDLTAQLGSTEKRLYPADPRFTFTGNRLFYTGAGRLDEAILRFDVVRPADPPTRLLNLVIVVARGIDLSQNGGAVWVRNDW